MPSLNQVQLIGYIGQDVELRSTQSGKSVCTFSVATSFKQRDSSGNTSAETTEWHRVVCWNALAERCAEYVGKGSLVHVQGRLQTRSWEDDAGTTRKITEIVAQGVLFLSRKKEDVEFP